MLRVVDLPENSSGLYAAVACRIVARKTWASIDGRATEPSLFLSAVTRRKSNATVKQEEERNVGWRGARRENEISRS